MAEFLRDGDFLDDAAWWRLEEMGIGDAALYEADGAWHSLLMFTPPAFMKWPMAARPTRADAVGAARAFLEGLLVVRAVVQDRFPPIEAIAETAASRAALDWDLAHAAASP